MITISTRDYTTEQLKDLAYGLSFAQGIILKRYGCRYDVFCNRSCEGYAMCTDLFNAWRYVYESIREREAIDVQQDIQERRTKR